MTIQSALQPIWPLTKSSVFFLLLTQLHVQCTAHPTVTLRSETEIKVNSPFAHMKLFGSFIRKKLLVFLWGCYLAIGALCKILFHVDQP